MNGTRIAPLMVAIIACIGFAAFADDGPTHDPRAAHADADTNEDGQVDRAEFRHSGPVQLDVVTPLGHGPHLRGDTRNLRMHQTVRFRKL